ncbi:glycogen debranching protein GlgX [Neisseria animalis]|uniref:Glycogen debranching enzyme GlgX n=1 Tax=Neisseria animalis TaxID=492 RepID=A0A5P3MTB6_NEIAN|nr:glycogen debranching protein GlgX [Neisseria animalis]QEY24768.1 glycogen debranching enzyme GlgX [Neisseria animalis]ROW31832.1 glycogen debranching enzyme GlgX [Neisseria animalis]VEE07755.1 Glycogen debranching enzyme [Neisseria animalis]
MMTTALTWYIETGSPYPMGATLTERGANFTLFSHHAEKVELCLFDGANESRLQMPARSGSVFHGFVPGVKAGQRYGFRVYGDNGKPGNRFNPQKLLIDPYSKKIDGKPHYRTPEEMAWFHFADGRDNAALAPKSIVVGASIFDWEDDRRPNTPWHKTVIYEAHIKGLTKQFPDLQHAGTYRALADERVISYLKNLGITAVELLPLHQHLDEYHLQYSGLSNYWGYNTYSHFAVEPDYAAQAEHADEELKTAVKALHRAGLEVILDVVYNHTADQDEHGPMLCQRGIDNASWYWTQQDGRYENWSGCGNTLNVAQRDVARWVADSLRYWAETFHIDGFRFDLGTILGREPQFQAHGRFLNLLYQDPQLASCKLIAEAWDIGADGYHVGSFPAPFSEWNGRFRDDMRAFWVWESGNLGAFAERLSGSADIFGHNGRPPSASVNFITAHDGFTLNDLVSYNEKHNHANGEHNRDGHNDNISYNHGAEGATDDTEILTAREYTAKALLASLFLSAGTPMLLGGDEFGNSQQGNNNGYCQDNTLTWLDWPSAKHPLQNYTQQLINLRAQIPLIGLNRWWQADDVRWLDSFGSEMTEEDWHNRHSKAMQVAISGGWLLLVNAKRQPQSFKLPQGNWQLASTPSEKFDYTKNGLFSVEHMGIWVLQKHDTRP